MKRGMLAVLFLVLLTSAAGADWWYRYQGTMTWNTRFIASGSGRNSHEFYVLLCYDTTPWSIEIQRVDPLIVYFSGEFDKEGKTLQFRASGTAGAQTVVGRGSFNAKETSLNLQGWALYLPPGSRSQFLEYRFRGKFVDTIWRP